MPDAPRRRRRALWIIPLGVLALVAAAAVGVSRLENPGDPAATATRFWKLLADGRAQEALALTTTPAVDNGLLLTDAVYGGADRGIADIEAHSFTTRGGEASGTIGYTLHGQPQTARVQLVERRNGLLSRPSWRLTTAPISTLEVTVASGGQADSLAVDGHALPLPDGDGRLAIPALPGSYRLALGVSSGLFSPVQKTVSVSGGTTAVTLGVTPSSALGKQAVAQTTALLNGCFAKPALAAGCPIADGIRNVFDLIAEQTVTYQLTRAPKLSFDAATMRVGSTSDAAIVANGTDPSLGTFHNTAQVSLAFDVAVRGGKVVLTPHQGGVTNDNLVLSSRD